MSHSALAWASSPGRWEGSAWWSLLAVVLALFLAGQPVAAVAVLAFAVLQRARPLDFMSAYMLVVAGASFVDYTHGTLTAELSVLSVAILFMLFCYLLATRGEALVLQRAPLTIALLLYTGLTVLNFLRGLAVGNSARYAGLELLAVLALASCLLVANLRPDHARVRFMLGALWIIALGHVALGLYTFSIIHTRAGSIYFTSVPGMVAVLLFNFALRGHTTRERWLPMAALLPLMVHQLLSFTRGYWLGILAGVTCSVVVYAGRGPGARMRWASAGRLLAGLVLCGVIAGVILATVFDIPGLGEGVWRRFSTSGQVRFSSESASNIFRLLEYDQVLRDLAASPWLGRGLGYYFTSRDPFFHTLHEQWYVHQNYLLVWLKQGLPGLALFVAALVLAVAAGVRGSRLAEPWAAAWCAGTAAVTVQVMTFANMHFPLAEVNATFPLALMWGVCIALTSRGRWRFVWRRTPVADGRE